MEKKRRLPRRRYYEEEKVIATYKYSSTAIYKEL